MLKNKLALLYTFYKNTLALSIALSSLVAILSIFNIAAMLISFGVVFLSGGTVVALLYQEMSRQHEYYFYYNLGIAKWQLFLTCAVGNIIVGTAIIILGSYA